MRGGVASGASSTIRHQHTLPRSANSMAKDGVRDTEVSTDEKPLFLLISAKTRSLHAQYAISYLCSIFSFTISFRRAFAQTTRSSALTQGPPDIIENFT
jgi:hypothetical protein